MRDDHSSVEAFAAEASRLIIPSRYAILDQRGFFVDLVEYLYGIKCGLASGSPNSVAKRLEPKQIDARIKKILTAEIDSPVEVRNMLDIDTFLGLIRRGYTPEDAQQAMDDVRASRYESLGQRTPRLKSRSSNNHMDIINQVYIFFSRYVDPQTRQRRKIFTDLIADVFALLNLNDDFVLEYWVDQFFRKRAKLAKKFVVKSSENRGVCYKPFV